MAEWVSKQTREEGPVMAVWGNLNPGLAWWFSLAAGYASTVEAEEHLIGQQLHTWVELNSLLRLGKQHSLGKVKAASFTPKIKVLGSPGWGLGLRLTTLHCNICYRCECSGRNSWTESKGHKRDLDFDTFTWNILSSFRDGTLKVLITEICW